jgi:phage terminase Nu1 subunit (DNA packaging protein)
MADDLPETIGSKVLAALHGITVQALGQLEARGIVRKLRRNAYATVEASSSISRHYREMAAGRKSENEDVDLVHERALLAREQRRGQEIKNAASTGELLQAVDVTRRWDTAAGLIRAGVLAAPTAIAQALAHLTRHDIETIDRILRDALSQAADAIDGLGDIGPASPPPAEDPAKPVD